MISHRTDLRSASQWSLEWNKIRKCEFNDTFFIICLVKVFGIFHCFLLCVDLSMTENIFYRRFFLLAFHFFLLFSSYQASSLMARFHFHFSFQRMMIRNILESVSHSTFFYTIMKIDRFLCTTLEIQLLANYVQK